MTKRKSTRSALFSSVVALLLCFTMLIGTTFAWFTDSVTSANNIIQAGNLDVEMYWADGDEDPATLTWNKVEGQAIFNNDKWEPGYVEAKHIKIANEGNLAFKWRLRIVPNGEVEALADVIDVYYVEGAKQLTREMLESVTPICTLRDLIDDVDGAAHGALLPEDGTVNDAEYEKVGAVTATIAFKMRDDVGNEYQGMSIGTDFSLQLMATQYAYEEDSFNNQYDKDAKPWDGTADVSWYNDTDTEFTLANAEEFAGFAAIVNGTATSGVTTYSTEEEVQTFKDSFKGKTVRLADDIDLDYRQWTPIGNTTNYFEGEFDGQGYTISHMYVNANTPNAEQFAGLFGAVKKATIKNLVMNDSSINAVGSKVRAAAVVGLAHSNSENRTDATLNFENITVDGCNITAEATSSTAMVGGIAGYCYPANMKNIVVSDLVIDGKSASNSLEVGGIAGYVCGQNISNGAQTRAAFVVEDFDLDNITINAEAYSVLAGGYTGDTYYGYITLKNGTIDGIKITVDANEAFVGGLVGYFWRSDNGHNVENVNITGIDFDVTTDYLGETRVGGMVGYLLSTANFTDCSVSGKITEKCSTGVVNPHAKAGGFVGRGYTWPQSYTNCVADVDITASHVAGGFIGNHITDASYTNCEAKGDVTANIAGGFAGRLTAHTYSTAVTFVSCKASGKVTGTNVAGGFIGSTADHGWAAWVAGNGTGYANTVTVKDCEITATVTSGTDYCAGVVGEAKMADDVEIVIEKTKCEITPTVFPNE